MRAAVEATTWSGRSEARSGLRMIPTFPRSSLRFRTAGFPSLRLQGWPIRQAFPDHAPVKLAPSMPVAWIRFASILRALRGGMDPPF